MFRHAATIALFVFMFGTSTVESAPPPPSESGRIQWLKGYPNVTSKGVELAGTITVGDGWKIASCQAAYCPAQGGQPSEPIELQIVDGKWGAKDAAGKFVPAKLHPGKGKWTISVSVVFEKTDADGGFKQVAQTPGEPTIEVK